jgi:succinoglycan biosynthesis transport protein ExoP
MLQTNDRQNAESHSSAPAESSLAELFDFFWGILRQQFLTILSVALLAIALAAIYIYVTPPTYTARSTLIIDRQKVQTQLGGMARELPVGGVEMESQAMLVKSEAVALAVIKALNLEKRPEFIDPPKGLIQTLRSKFLSDDERAADVDPVRVAAAALEKSLAVNRMGSNIVEIEVAASTPELSAEIANAFADAYIDDRLQSRYQAARQAGSWLEDRIRELGAQVLRADEEIEAFKAKNKLVTVGGKLINDQMLAELNTQHAIAREKMVETRARLDRIEAIINADSPDKPIVGTVTETLNNPIIVALRTQYLDLARRQADWSSRFGKNHQAVTNLGRQITEVRASIADELNRIAETYRSDYAIAKQRLADMEKTVATAVSQFQLASQAQIELRQLENAAETYRGLYKTALQRNTELVQQQSFPGTEARLIARALPPTSKSSPKSLIVLFGATALGTMLGMGLGIARTTLERVFRTSKQLESTLQVSCLALAPVLAPSKVKSAPAATEPRTIVRNDNVIWEVIDRPLSRFAEGMRSIKLAADLRRSVKIVGVTSALPNEGKTTIGAALALLIAQTGARTVLVDCDLRHPALSSVLAPRAEHGVLDVLSGKKPLEEVLWTEPTTGLSFLPGAGKSRVVHSSEVLASPALQTLFNDLREKYAYVIVDLPPLAPIIDVRSTTGLVDGYVFVVAWGQTKIGVAELALSHAPEVYESLLGAVLNKVDFKVLGRHEGHYSGYYSNKHYAQYGID